MSSQCTAVQGVIIWSRKTLQDFNNDADDGQLVGMSFTKKRNDTHLRLTWNSAMRQHLASKCSQWYFRIAGNDCNDPAPINGVVYTSVKNNYWNNAHRHGTIIGVCRGTLTGALLTGDHQIAINVGNCPNHHGGDTASGWDSTTTTMIKEKLCPSN